MRKKQSVSVKVKVMIMELSVYTLVVLGSATALSNLTPHYIPDRYTAQGRTDIVMVQVPIPVEQAMEGKQFDYTVMCNMKNNAVRCGL